eukprot:751896-Hanusia_phi.AAC.1
MTEPLAGCEDEGVMVAKVNEETAACLDLLLHHLPLPQLHLLVVIGRTASPLHDFFLAVPISQ